MLDSDVIGASAVALAALDRALRCRTPATRANLITCIVFQVAFVVEAARLWLSGAGAAPTRHLMATGVGYFLYDSVVLWRQDRRSPFLLHHLAAIAILLITAQLPSLETDPAIYQALCFVGEVTNPFLNARRLLAPGTALARANDKASMATWIVFRLAAFPWLSWRFMTGVEAPWARRWLWTLFGGVYGASVVWAFRLASAILRGRGTV